MKQAKPHTSLSDMRPQHIVGTKRHRSKGLRPSLRTTLLFMASTAVLMVLAWIASGSLAKDREAKLLERERIMATTTAETISANLGRNLGQLHSIPMVLAGEPALIATLKRFGPHVQPSTLPVSQRRAIWQAEPEFAALTKRFEEIIKQADVSQIWITNAAADCFVSAGFPEELTSTGVNYAKRHYFQEARQGRHGSQFAVGATTNIPGLFFSAPVMADGYFLGVVVVKLELPKLAELVASSNAFLSDENGVIVLAQIPDALMQTVPEATVYRLSAEALDNRYRRKTFTQVDIRSVGDTHAPDLVYWQGNSQPYVLKKRNLPGEVITIHVLRPLDELTQIRFERLWLFALLSLLSLLLVSLTTGAALFLRRNREVHEELTLLANTDALTSCANRRSFLATLKREWKSSSRYGTAYCVITVDLDYFKSINDRFGHSGGDKVLCHFVDIVSKSLRPCDTIGRIGGEEFAILLPQTQTAGAVAVAERILKEVKAKPVLLDKNSYLFTFSAGIAEWHPDDKACTDILKRADSALYRAKNAGRDKVMIAD